MGHHGGALRLRVHAVVGLQELRDPVRHALLGADVGEDPHEEQPDDRLAEELDVGRPAPRPLLIGQLDPGQPHQREHDDHGEGDHGEEPVQRDPRQVRRNDARERVDQEVAAARVAPSDGSRGRSTRGSGTTRARTRAEP